MIIMFTIYLNGKKVPGVHDLEGAKMTATLLHVQFEAAVDVVYCETGEVIFSVIDRGDYWEIYESEPDVIEVDFIIIEI